jgi:tRNA pseudouridine38-40 synthase
MAERTLQLVLHYDGAGFAGWQIQPAQRTIQGVLEDVLARLCGERIGALGAGRTDAGVHARGQAVGVRVPPRWTADTMRRALNSLLPDDVWVASAHEMQPAFHARYSATARAYSYTLGLDDASASPFRRRWEWRVHQKPSLALLQESAASLVGEHTFRAFAVRGTAPEHDAHRCTILRAEWTEQDGRAVFQIEANRFLHHMVRFLVGTMVAAASGQREPDSIPRLLAAGDNSETSAPAPPHALFLDRVLYPEELYVGAH